MEYIEITNFRGIPDLKIPLSQFVCIIGENNSGKSSILLALNIFYSGAKLTESDYFNKEEEIKIGIKFSEISENDLNRLSDTHKKKISESVVNKELSLVRIYDISGKSRLHYKTLKPIDPKYSEDNINSLLKGKKKKEVETEMVDNFPEHSTRFKGITTHKKAREIIQKIINEIPVTKKQHIDEKIPTGMDSSIKAFLPEPIFVAAVKDLSDEVKTKQTATFGKLLNFVMSLIIKTEKFQEITNSFNKLNKLLNFTIEEGDNDNGRLEEIIDIERRIEKNLQESFPNLKLDIKIPPPELNQIFSNAQLCVDDGVRDKIETKGDGVKRSMVYSLLRTYVDLQREKEKSEDKANYKVSFRPYMILFEEPELYLHPHTQKIMFSALEGLSKNNFIILTTHAPNFYSPDQIATFVHLRKMYPSDGIPYGVAKSIDLLKEISLRNILRLICYENNSAAFFSKKVLLVEGGSDLFYIRHISGILNKDWDFCRKNIPIIRIHGKGNIKLYKEFFEYFEIEVHCLLDLDVLIKGFEKLNLSENLNEEHSKLIQEIDKLIEEKKFQISLSRENIRDIVKKMSFRQKYERLKELADKTILGDNLSEDEIKEIRLLFSDEMDYNRIEAIKQGLCKEEVLDFLIKLYKERVYLLSKGTIEEYYPSNVTGREKTERALSACDLLSSKEDVENIFPILQINREEEVSEFELIFQNIFG